MHQREGVATSARESNAGDDFHFLWASQQVLQLLDHRSSLRRVTVEALAAADDPDDDFEAIDVAEYYGGDNLTDAKRVVASQLKYSFTHPQKPWTAARLCRLRRPGRSVLRDLAGLYQRLVDDRSRELVVDKITIKLVSNQPPEALLLDGITAASNLLTGSSDPMTTAALLRQLPAQSQSLIRQMSEHLRGTLKSDQFTDFLRTLDLSGLGEPSRFGLRQRISGSLAKLAPGSSSDPTHSVYHLVRHEAGPEGKGSAGITAADVLAHLGVDDEDDLHPAPSRIVHVDSPLPTLGVADLAHAVLTAPAKFVVAHGAPGVGKTTTLSQLEGHLPAGSVVIVYDCFGGGDYLNSGEERHSPRRFVLQVVNDLAAACGSPLLIHPPDRDEDLWRLLRRRLDDAVALLPDEARLVVAVDAADNASFAATTKNEVGLVEGLMSLPAPAGVHLVVTARTHRWKHLQPPADSAIVEIKGFDAAASAQHLRRSFLGATHDDAAVFHTRTDGNPRMQSYILSRAGAEGMQLGEVLTLCQKTPSDLFKDLVASAQQVVEAPAGADRLAVLIALERPVPTQVLATAFGTSVDNATAFVAGLFPGVVLEADTVRFRDEDFEGYVRNRVDGTELKRAHSHLADVFRPLDDAYAASAIAEHLFHAGRTAELIDLVMTETAPTAIPDGFRRAEVQRSRLRRALSAASMLNEPSALALTLRAADAVASHKSLHTLARRHIELTVRHADPAAATRSHLREDADEWLAPGHLRAAGALSRDPATAHEAVQHLDRAEAWMRRLKTEDDYRGTWSVEPIDIACGAEAVYRLRGAASARSWLARWRPRDSVHAASALLAERVAAGLGPTRVRDELATAKVPLTWHAPFAVALWRSGQNPDPDWVEAIVRVAVKAPPPSTTGSWLADLCSMAMAVLHDRATITQLIGTCRLAAPLSRRFFNDPFGDDLSYLRLQALAAVADGRDAKSDDLMPAAWAKPVTGYDQHEGERRRFSDTVDPLLAAGTTLARALAAESPPIDEIIGEGLNRRKQAATHRWFRGDADYRAWAFLMAEAVSAAGMGAELVERLADAALDITRDGAPFIWLDLAAWAGRRGSEAELVLALCERAANHAETAAYPTAEALDIVARAAELADEVSPETARMLFERATAMATLLDDDRARLLDVHIDLARASAGQFEPVQARLLADRMAEAATQTEARVTDRRLVPYEATLAAITRLHPPSGLAWAARWDDEERCGIDESVPKVVAGAVQAGFIDVRQATGLLNLTDLPEERVTATLRLLDNLPRTPEHTATISETLRRLSYWLRRFAPAHQQPHQARKVLTWATARKISFAGRAELQAVQALTPVDEAPDRHPALSSPANYDQRRSRLLTAKGRIWQDLPTDIGGLTTAYATQRELADFIVGVVRAARLHDRPAALDAVTELPIDTAVSPATVLAAIRELLGEWRTWPTVTTWARQALPGFVDQHLPVLSGGHGSTANLTMIRDATDDQTATQILAAATARHLQDLSARALYNIASALSVMTSPASAAEALDWSLRRFHLTEPADRVAPPDPAAQAVSGFLWSLLGHHIKAIRWRAAYAIRDLLERPDHDLAAALIGKLQSTSAAPYRSPTLDFYWLSARTWLLVAIERVCAEHPDRFAPLVDDLAAVATDRDEPHIQVRELARRSALTVLRSQPHPDPALVETLAKANVPAVRWPDDDRSDGAARRSEYPEPDSRDPDLESDDLYTFDQVDTIPYWYEPLARAFDIDVNEITRRARRWIVHVWGRTKDDWMKDVRELRDERSYERMSHRHGIIPPEESLQLYLEYHAMLLAAGELVDQGMPAKRSSDDDHFDTWDRWLAEHLPINEQWWLSDLVDPVPSEPVLFGTVEPLEQWQERTAADFDTALGLDEGGTVPADALVEGVTSLYRPGGYGRNRIRSALVSPSAAMALLRALQSASDPNDWRLPDEGEDQFEIDVDELRLRGWLTEDRIESDSIDSLDPRTRGVQYAVTLPGRAFREIMHVALAVPATALVDESGTRVAWTRRWADEPPNQARYRGEVYSTGARTFVRRDALLKFLAAVDMTLIMEVRLERQRERRGSSERAFDRGITRLYLVDQSGNIRTL